MIPMKWGPNNIYLSYLDSFKIETKHVFKRYPSNHIEIEPVLIKPQEGERNLPDDWILRSDCFLTFLPAPGFQSVPSVLPSPKTKVLNQELSLHPPSLPWTSVLAKVTAI